MLSGMPGPLDLTDLLKRAIQVGAREVRVTPGRRTIVSLPQGDSEVRGDTWTADSVEQLIAPIVTPAVRRMLGLGLAEWEFELEGRGVVRAHVEVKAGAPHVSFGLERIGGANANRAGAEPRGAPASPGGFVEPRGVPASPGGFAEPRITTASAGAEVRIPSSNSGAIPLAEEPRAPSLAASRASFDEPSGPTGGIDRLLGVMLEKKASDLHVSTGSPPLLRVDGEMVPIAGEGELTSEIMHRLLWPIVPERNREEYERTHDCDFAYDLPGRARFRVNLFVDLHGMGAVFRVIPSKILTVDDLGLPKELLTLCHLPKGLVLVTGPTGSGKSTTLAALIDYINRNRSAHVITIEDPIEFVHPNKKCLINQRQVGEHTDSFKRALRAALREDPDIVLLGEMRDLETVSIAIETAETGHLVFGTLHTSSAPSTIDRIIDQYPPEQQNQIRVMLSSSLKGVISQMLCKKNGGGRVAALEVMLAVPAIANLIRESKIFQIPSIMQTGRKLGMALMNDSLLKLVKDGVVSAEEALSKSYDRSTLTTLLQQAGVSVPNLG
jgi:twitching motility protein PilT